MIPPLSSRLGRPLCFIQKPQAYGCYCLPEFQAHKFGNNCPCFWTLGEFPVRTSTWLRPLSRVCSLLESTFLQNAEPSREDKGDLCEWSRSNGVKTILLALFRQLTANSQLSTWRDTTLLSTVLPQHTLETHLHASFKEQKLINASGCVYWR